MKPVLLTCNDGRCAKLLDAARADPADPCRWLVLCDALDEAGATLADVVWLYAAPPPWPPEAWMRRHAAPPFLPFRQLPALPPPAEDDSLRPLLVAWTETRVDRELAERVRAYTLRAAATGDGRPCWWVSANPPPAPGAFGDYSSTTINTCRRDLKRRVLAELDDRKELRWVREWSQPLEDYASSPYALAEMQERIRREGWPHLPVVRTQDRERRLICWRQTARPSDLAPPRLPDPPPIG